MTRGQGGGGFAARGRGSARKPAFLGLPLALVVGLQACKDRHSLADLGVVYDTIAGVEHIVSLGDGAWAKAGTAWSLDEPGGLALGQLDGPDEYVFGQISDVVVDSQDRIYVADPQAKEVRVFSPRGEFLRRLGREGEGPGEFRHVGGLAVAPDGIAALDPILRRVTVFDTSGDAVRTFRLTRSSMVLEDHPAMAFDSRGRFFERARLSEMPEMDSVGVVAYDPTGAVSDTVFLAEIRKYPVTIQGSLSLPRPLVPQPSITFGLEGTFYLARGAEYRVDVFSPSGDSLRVIRRTVKPSPVSAVERDSAVTLIARVFKMYGSSPPARMELPRWKPIIAGLAVDSEGNLWVLNEPSSGASRFEWSVHDPEGRYLGTVTTPVMTVTQIGANYLAGTMKDSLGTPRVVVLPLRRAGG